MLDACVSNPLLHFISKGVLDACVSNPLLHFISKGELDAADVELEVQEEAQEWEQPQGFSPQYVRELLTSCVQAAVALVDKRGSEHDARATRRIKVMLTLMKGKCAFLVLLCLYFLFFFNSNGYLDRLTNTGTKRLHIL